MMKKFYLILTCAALCACGGGNKQQSNKQSYGTTITDDLVICDFDQVGDEITIPLSEWVEDFQIVRFDNKDEAIFKMWWPLITDNYIGIRQRDGGAFKLFDRQGKLLCDVGGVGGGPGEYKNLYSEAIDEKNGWIYLAPFAWSDHLLKYDLEGKYIGKVEVGENLNKPKIQMLPDGNLALAHMYFHDNKSTMMAATISPKGKVTKCPDVPQHLHITFRNQSFPGFSHEVWHYGCTDDLKFAYTISDTLYAYDHKTNRLKADFVMKNYRKTDDIYCIYFPLPGKYVTYVRGKGHILTDPQTQQSHFIKLKNDFVGGLKVNTNFSNGYIFMMYEPLQLMEQIEKRLEESDCTDADKKVLKELYDSLDEDDNNIMFIGKLKNKNHTIHTSHKNKTKIIDNEKQKEINSPTNERPKLSASSSTNNTHKTVPDTIKIYEESEVKRAFLPLSNSQLIEFLTKNFKYPSIPPINGKGKVDLVIERDGRVSDVIIVQSIHPEIDKEFVRILKLLPKFTPGSINGISVRSKYRVPTTSVCK